MKKGTETYMEFREKLKAYEKFGSVLGLERVETLLALLGNPEAELNCIHVAGTNGKGSVCRYIYEVLCEAGYKVGLYTSPFIEVFNERIEVNREYIKDEELEEIFAEVELAISKILEEGKNSPTEFEIVTAMAFLYFKKKKVDFVVLEVGLGGRFDATNIIQKPLASVITSISIDHTEQLGEKIEQIAFEKAGIIKKNCPVIISVKDVAAKKVIARQAYHNNALLIDSTKIKTFAEADTENGTAFSCKIKEIVFNNIEIQMLGSHQVRNAVLALQTIEFLQKNAIIKLDKYDIYAGLKKAKQKGRLELLKGDKVWLLDGAHNTESAEALFKLCQERFANKKKIVIIGVLADKLSRESLSYFLKLSDDFISVDVDSPRSLKKEELKEIIESKGKNCVVAENNSVAIEMAKEKAEANSMIVITGSLYLVGQFGTIIRNGRC
ncbi:MAG: bifunctional folylpolyglutamate synthase/dihydrofolate synthase [Anaerovoracaceae bacterium]